VKLPFVGICTDAKSAIRLVLILFFAAQAGGCALLQPAQLNKPHVQEVRVRSLERELKLRQTELDGLRERNIVLEGRVHLPANQEAAEPLPQRQADHRAKVTAQSIADFLPAPQSIAAADSTSTAPPMERLGGEKTPNVLDASLTGEQLLYSKVLESYRTHKMDELQKTLQILLKTYPDSIFADNAVYMAGLLAFESGELNRADLLMDRVLRDFPRGNKAVSAMFAKAMIQKKSRKLFEARHTLASLRQLYPGSPEAARADVEVKMVDMMTAKKQ
jgi:TolA-binding protein